MRIYIRKSLSISLYEREKYLDTGGSLREAQPLLG